jgi:beta-RFAP synthase
MNAVRIQTPSRLHFGLLAWKSGLPREFGGVGLAVAEPGIHLEARPAGLFQAEGPLARRALQVAERVVARLGQQGTKVPGAKFRIERAQAEHVGLGTGTQLGLAVAQSILMLAGQTEPPVADLAALAERGLRSGIGLHAFAQGGLLVDGGRRAAPAAGAPPLLSRMEFPTEWSVLVVVPDAPAGLHGLSEVQAFSQLPPIPDRITERLCRLVLLGLLPAVAERDLVSFGNALDELQALVGQCFAPAQGGSSVRPELQGIVQALRALGLHGVGQSSWGPALYGFSVEPAERRTTILQELRDKFGFAAETACWTKANNTGRVIATAK